MAFVIQPLRWPLESAFVLNAMGPIQKNPNAIAVFMTHANGAYGANRSLVTLINSVAASQKVLLIAPLGASQNLAGILSENANNVIALRMPWLMAHTYERGWRWFLRLVRHCIGTLKATSDLKITPQVSWVYSNSVTIPWGAVLARKLRKYHIWHIREFGDLDYDLRWMLPRAIRIKLLLSAERIICVSKAVAKHHGIYGNPKTRILYNGVMYEEEMRYLNPQLPIEESGIWTLGAIGYLAEGKCFDIAIKAIALLTKRKVQVRLKIFGTGPVHVENQLKALIDSLGLDAHISLVGFVENPQEIFESIDCLLMTARAEAFGRTTAEAMAWGVPVIGSNTGGTMELIEDEISGFLFDGTPENLADKVTQVVQNSLILTDIRHQALNKAKQNFSIESYTTGFAEIISELSA